MSDDGDGCRVVMARTGVFTVLSRPECRRRPTPDCRSPGENAFGGFFGGLAGQAWVDGLFMIGLLGIGVALIVGAGIWIAAIAGGVLLVLMWAAGLPLETNPFLDEHLLYALVLAGLALSGAGDVLGIGVWWGRTSLVRRLPILK